MGLFEEPYSEQDAKEQSNLMAIAFDEMTSGQYEEAAEHFNKIYEKNPSNYMAFFHRAFCKSHLGNRANVGKRENAKLDSEMLTSAFKFAAPKAIEDEQNRDTCLTNIFLFFQRAMNDFAERIGLLNDWEEIVFRMGYELDTFIMDNISMIKSTETAKELGLKRLKQKFDSTVGDLLKHYDKNEEGIASNEYDEYYKDKEDSLREIGPMIVELDPSFESTYKNRVKEIERAKEEKQQVQAERKRASEEYDKKTQRKTKIGCFGAIIIAVVIMILMWKSGQF